MRNFLVLLFDFFAVPSLRLFGAWFLISLLACFFAVPIEGIAIFSFWDYFGFVFVSILFAFFPFSREVHEIFCVLFFGFAFALFGLVLYLVSFIQDLGGT